MDEPKVEITTNGSLFSASTPFFLVSPQDDAEDSSNSAYHKASSTSHTSALDANTHNMPMGHIHDDGPQPLDQAMLRKYIAYARANVKPILHDLDTEKVCCLILLFLWAFFSIDLHLIGMAIFF